MINSVIPGHYVKFYEKKPHEIFKVLSINKKKGTLTIKCSHCNMIVHGIPYFLMEIIPTPKNIKKSKLKVIYR